MQLRGATLLVLFILVSCRESSTAPQPPRVSLDVVGSASIHAAPSSMLPQPLRVVVRNAATGAAISGEDVEWSVTGGAVLATGRSTSDEYGVAEVFITSAASGTATITASAQRLQGAAPRLEVHSVPRGVIDGIAPATITGGAEIVITGRNFSSVAADNVVLFDGVRGLVTAASTTSLQVVTPACMPQRTVSVQAGVGYAVSTGWPLAITAAAADGMITLAPGQARRLTTAAELACIRLDAEAGAEHLLITQHAASTLTPPVPLELRSLGAPPPIAAAGVRPPTTAYPQAWEALLRLREAGLPPGDAVLPHVQAAAIPNVGEQREFSVYNASNTFDKVTAAARVVTQRVIIYVDVEAATAFSTATLEYFAQLFDEPIHPTVTAAFGTPSDIDGNGRVLILFTPMVNALTPRGSGSFVAGYFYGCDLVSRSRCSGSNRAEIFYSMVPDPEARWGDRRSTATVTASVPPVLAHEFQHMIHFARRGFSTDVLWLSEALAHTAEELVADVLEARGDVVLSEAFRQGNISRARQYLFATATTSLVAEEAPGSLEVRGAGWLLLRYLRGHFGGNELLHRLTGSTRTGAANVSAEIGRPWDRTIADFAVALWALGAPDYAGALVPEHRFSASGPQLILPWESYPLQPWTLPWGDFSTSMLLPPASAAYWTVRAPATPATPLGFVLAGAFGLPIGPDSDVQLTLLRVR